MDILCKCLTLLCLASLLACGQSRSEIEAQAVLEGHRQLQSQLSLLQMAER